MNKLFRAFLRAGIFLLLFAARPAFATIHYTISLDHPEQHRFHVTMSIPNGAPSTIVALPAWNALYQIRDFSERVRDVEAAPVNSSGHGGARLFVRALDKQTWQLGEANSWLAGDGEHDLLVSYSIEWDDPGPFNSQLNTHHAFLNLGEVLFYLPNRRHEAADVEFTGLPASWKIAAELPASESKNSLSATSYDALVDAPVEIGPFSDFAFKENGARFRVVIDAANWDRGNVEDKLRKIVGYETRLMGGPPFPEYTFFFHIGPYSDVGGGGMEHANCTAIASGSETGVINIAAHEFFHAWNVKRIRPQTLEPVDYTKEQWTRALWFAEGVTSTYASFTLVRSGIWTTDAFYGDLADQLVELDSSPARLWQSVEESSLDTWLDKYDAYRAPDRSISYYNKGQILGDLLDLAIRDDTDNKKSLDDVLRLLYAEFAQQGRYYNDSADIRTAVEQVTGKSFDEFFRRYVSGVSEISYQDFLAYAGLRLKQSTKQVAELGFFPGRGSGNGWSVAGVTVGSSAEAAGLRTSDQIVRLNGEALPQNPFRWMRERAPGETIRLHVRRDGEEKDISFAFGTRDQRDYSIEPIPNPSDKQRRIREGILHGTNE
ncbi:MAG: hypothetical protein WA755_05070 [Candidatus Acidiferrales bacterium]